MTSMADTQGVMKEVEAKMAGALEALGREFAAVRTGRGRIRPCRRNVGRLPTES